MTGAAVEPANKRMRGNNGNAIPMSDFKSQLVHRIKYWKKMAQENKDTWHSYCDTYLNGMYDPSRHDENTLQEFINCNDFSAVPEHALPAITGGDGGSWGVGNDW